MLKLDALRALDSEQWAITKCKGYTALTVNTRESLVSLWVAFYVLTIALKINARTNQAKQIH